jgi:hypothetical protein
MSAGSVMSFRSVWGVMSSRSVGGVMSGQRQPPAA